jgi:hypothetical protein
MNDDFLSETVWVMFAYGAWYLASGLAVSSVIVIGASRCARLRFRLPILFTAALVLWIAMFIAADSGYRAWQSIPNVPKEAFSDTGPLLFLAAGWIPGIAVAYLLLRICWWISPRPTLPGRESQSKST